MISADENITRSFVEQVEKELTLGGRHTYLYAPKDDEPVGLVVRHLNRAGIIVLLVLNKDLKNKEEIKRLLSKIQQVYQALGRRRKRRCGQYSTDNP